MSMRYQRALAVLLLLALLVAGCAQAQPTAQPTPAAPAAEATATLPASEAYPAPPTTETNAEPTAPAGEAYPALPEPTAPAEPYDAPAPEDAASEAPAAALTSQVKIFLVAPEDKGQTGKLIGCDDSIVAVERPIEPTTEPLKAALEQLLSLRERGYGQSGLYNALYQSRLQLDSVSVTGDRADVALSGDLMLGGVCDNPRVEAQIEETVLQFPEVKQVQVTVNGVPLEELLSQQG